MDYTYGNDNGKDSLLLRQQNYQSLETSAVPVGFEHVCGAMAQWLECRIATEGSCWVRILVEPLQNFGNSVLPLKMSFRGDTESRRLLLSGVYARGSKISHTGGKCVTCHGLHNCEIYHSCFGCLDIELAVWSILDLPPAS